MWNSFRPHLLSASSQALEEYTRPHSASRGGSLWHFSKAALPRGRWCSARLLCSRGPGWHCSGFRRQSASRAHPWRRLSRPPRCLTETKGTAAINEAQRDSLARRPTAPSLSLAPRSCWTSGTSTCLSHSEAAGSSLMDSGNHHLEIVNVSKIQLIPRTVLNTHKACRYSVYRDIYVHIYIYISYIYIIYIYMYTSIKKYVSYRPGCFCFVQVHM